MADPNLNIKVQATDETKAAFEQVRRSMEQTSATAAKMGAEIQRTQGSFRGVGYYAGQAGYQIQDFAVQVTGGTSALTAFGQQAPQFLGLFGPGGAIAGAAVAIGVLGYKLWEAVSAAEETRDALSDIADEVERINKATEKLVAPTPRLAGQLEIAKLQQELTSLERATQRQPDAGGMMGELGVGMEAGAVAAAKAAERIKELRQKLDELTEAERKAAVASAYSDDAFTASREGMADVFAVQEEARQKAAEEQQQAIDRLDQSIRSTINSLDPLRVATATYEERVRLLNIALEEGVITQAQYRVYVERSASALDAASEAVTHTVQVSREYNRALDDQAQRLREQVDPAIALARELEKIEELYRTGRISADEWAKASAAARDKLTEKTKQTDDITRDLGFTFQSAFEDAIVKGEKFRNVLGGIAQDLARLVLRQTVTRQLAGLASGFIDSGAGWLSGLFGGGGMMSAANAPWVGLPGFADGGSVTGGNPIIVGEQGPEIFVPSGNGQIIPNGETVGGVTVNQTINISTGVAQTVRAEISAMLPRIKRETLDAVADARMRGGSFAAAMGT